MLRTGAISVPRYQPESTLDVMANSEYENWERGRTPRRYEGLPVEAVRVDESNADNIVEWLASKGIEATNRDGAVSFGHSGADPGEWVVVTADNRVKSMADNLFIETYDGNPPPLAGA